MKIDYYVQVPIVVKKNPAISKLVGYLLILSYLFIFTCVLIETSSGLLTLALLLLLFFGICTVFFNKMIPIGTLELSNKEIKVMYRDIISLFSVEDLYKLKFSYGGYEGGIYWPNPTSIIQKDGTDNYLEFYFDGKKFKIEVLIEKKDLTQLNEIFFQWKNRNPNFIMIGEFGFKKNSI